MSMAESQAMAATPVLSIDGVSAVRGLRARAREDMSMAESQAMSAPASRIDAVSVVSSRPVESRFALGSRIARA
jgi:hypothetical protein